MVAIVSGNSLGLELTSLGVLGNQGLWGSSSQGNSGEQVYINAATGNLVVQRRDEFLASRGLDNPAVRTYNSLGQLTADTDNWMVGIYGQQLALSGTVNTVGSTLTRTARDGSQALYTWDTSRSCYVTQLGSGAHDTITYNTTTQEYARVDGSTREVEKYKLVSGTLRLTGIADAAGNLTSYTYHASSGMLLSVSDASGEFVQYNYDNNGAGTQLLSLTRSYKDANNNTITRSAISYGYDTNAGGARLTSVTVDLTPDNTTDNVVYTTNYSYIGTGKQLKTISQSDGSSLTFTYGIDSRVQTITDALGMVTTYSYDTTNRRTTVVVDSGTSGLNQTWLFDYDPNGQLTKLTSPAIGGTSITQSYSYDAAGNVTQIVNGDGEATTMAYDANGNQTLVTNALGNTVSRTYNANNQLLTETVSATTRPALVNQGGMSIIGTDIVKTAGTDGVWDASVRSGDGLTGGATVGFRPGQGDKAFMVGLNSDPGSNHGWTSLDYALYCTASGTLEVRESNSGNKLTSTVTYAAGDDLRVTYDGSKVTYLKNGVVFWTTTPVSVSGPLYADSSFYHVGAKISALSFGVTATTGGVPLVAESNATVTAGGTVTKTNGANGSWDASVRSLVGYAGGAMTSFTINQLDKAVMVGLNSDPTTNDSFTSIDYAIYCNGTGQLYVYENGARIDLGAPAPSYAVGDTYRVVYDGTKVQYRQIRAGVTTVLREVTVNITATLYLDTSFANAGARVDNLQFGKAGLTTVTAAAMESGAAVVGDTITKVGGTNGEWDTSVHSEVGYTGQVNLSFSAGQADKSFMVGLNGSMGASYSWTKLDYAFYCRSDGGLEVREGGSTTNKLTGTVTYNTTDKLQITYDGAYVRYLKNGVELLKTAATLTQPLYLDTSFAAVGAKLTNLRFGDLVSPDLTSRNVYSATVQGQLLYSITAQGRVTQYKYNSFGERISQITYPDNAYNTSGLASDAVPTVAQMAAWVTAIGDLKGSVRTDYAYDARGLLNYFDEYLGTNSDGTGQSLRRTQYVYDQAGRLLQTILTGGDSGDETGSLSTTYAYDGLGRVLTVTDPRGVVTTTAYSDSTQKVTITYQSGAVQTSVYDKAGRLVSVAKSGNGSTTYAYDAAGHLLMTTDALGVRSFWLYDEAGRQVAAIDASGTLTETTYDKAGRVTRIYSYANPVNLSLLVSGTGVALNPALIDVRPTGAATDVCQWNFYNDAGQLTYELAESGALTRHEYDDAGRLVRTVRFGQTIVTSGANYATITALLSESALAGGSAGDRSERYFYDGDGLLVATLDGEGYLTRITYDNAGRKVQSQRYATAVAAASRAGGGTLASLTPAASADDQTETYFYNGRGQLTGTVDALGYITRNAYNGRGLVRTQTRYATALATTPDWKADLDALITSTIRPSGPDVLAADDRRMTYYYRRDGQLLSATNFEGTRTSYEYDTAGRLIKTTVGDGRTDARVTQSRLDAWGQKTAVLGGGGSAKLTDTMTQAQIDAVWASDAVDYTYDSLGRVASSTDANGFKTLNFYDVDGRLTHTVNARGEVLETQYNTLGQRTADIRYGTTVSVAGLVGGLLPQVLLDRLAARTDKTQDSKTSYTYDNYGRLYSTTDPVGAVTYTHYNVFGEVSDRQVAWQAGANLNLDKRLETFAYDHRGLLTSVVRDDGGIGATTGTVYDAFGRLVSTTDPRTKTSTIGYDKLGRVIRTTNPLNKSVLSDYDAFGQVLHVTDELTKTTTYTYDRPARSVTMTTPEGVSVTTTRNVYGETYSVNDGNGVNHYFAYDQDGNLTQKKIGSTVIEADDHDAGGRLISSTDANGIITTYTYDDVNHTLTRVVEPTDADANVELNLTTKWYYDAKGQTIKVTDPRGTDTTYAFDLAGRTIKQIVDPNGLALKTEWTYDAEGRVATVLDANLVTTQYTYDELGRRLSEVVDTGMGHLNLTRSYTYDQNGNVLTATDRNGYVTRYGYDDAGRLMSTVDAEGSLTFNEYTAAGKLYRVTRYTTPWTGSNNPTTRPTTIAADQVTRYYYDDDGRLEYTVDAMGAVTMNEYDGDGNVRRITQYADTVTSSELATAVVANAALDHVTVIEYDSFDRETYRADPMGSVTRCEYDLNGNLVKRTRFYNTVAAGTNGSTVVVSSSDRAERFVYDGANRRTWASDPTGAVTQFSYDKLGNLTQLKRYATLAPGASPDTVVADAANDRLITYSYDRANRQTYTVDELGYVALRGYDGNGNVTSVRRFDDKPDSRGTPATAIANDTLDRVTGHEYDAGNRLRKTTDALGYTEEYTYDGVGNRLTFKNKSLNVWTYTYDKMGRMLTEVTPKKLRLWTTSVSPTTGAWTVGGGTTDEAITTTLTYDAFGNLWTRTEATGRAEERQTKYEYDKLNRQIKVTLPAVASYTSETAAQLVSNGRTGDATRTDGAAATPTTQTWYDVFGNAVASTDRAGATNYKAYDAAGRVTFEVDALGYVTGYDRNAFGEATKVTRFAGATTLNTTTGANAARDITTTSVDAVVNANGVDHSSDRVLSNAYDKAGRVIKVTEPSAYSYNSTTGRGTSNGKQTTSAYNAFGEVVQLGQLIDVDTTTNPDTLVFQYTYQYYDLGGRKTAVAVPGGDPTSPSYFLTKLDYDSEGNLINQVEYNLALSTTPTVDSPGTPTTSTKDRTTSWTWDKLNRKLTETKTGATVSSYNTDVLNPTLSTQTNQSLTTTYGYDAVGNLTSTQDAAGGVTYTYYDALGRIKAVVAPSRTSTWAGTVMLPVVEYRRDAYGNIVVQIERANTATNVTSTSYASSDNTGADRTTLSLFDANGNATQVQDAKGFQHYSSYTADGRLAKTWQTVTDVDLAKTTLYTRYEYDKLGRVVKAWTPSAVDGNATSTDYHYNAFGEVDARGRDNGWQEYFAFDNAGRLWKTNTGDGYATVYLYDLLDHQTAEISSAGSGRSGAVDVNTATSASQAAGWTSTRRVNIKYDAMGYVLVREEAERTLIEGGITIRKTNTTAAISSSVVWTPPSGGEDSQSASWTGTNSVALSWTTLQYLGSGDVRVDLTYQTKDTYTDQGYGSHPLTRTESQIFAGYQANSGVNLTWTGEGPDLISGYTGISAVNRLVVYKRNINGDWVKVIDRSPADGRGFGTFGTQIEIGEPLDPTTQVKFLYRVYGSNVDFSILSNAQLSKFGDSRWFDANETGLNLSGKYEYQVIFTPKDGVDEVRETGNFTAKTDDSDDSGQTINNWVRPTVVYTRDRWGNALTQSDPRNATWLTKFAYNRDNQVISETRPDPSNGDQGTGNNPTRTIYYDALGRQVAIKDEMSHTNGQLYDAGGNLVMEVHADGGAITNFYDAFGQRAYTVDALGNTSVTNGVLDKTTALYQSHTTKYGFDLLGRQITTTHGTVSGGSTNSYTVDSATLTLSAAVKSNLQETFSYDEAGRKIKQTNGATELTKYWYDRAGNVVKTMLPGGQSSAVAYDASGHKTSETDANAIAGNGIAATWTYDYFGQLQTHKDIGGATYSYVYDAAGQLTRQTNDTRGQNLIYGYDAAGQLVKVTDSTLGEVSTTVYDLAGHHLREKVVRNGQMFQDNHLSYDILGRLIDSADDRAHLTFQYDKAGNRTKVTTHVLVAQPGDDDVETAKDSTKFYVYDAMNRQLTVDGINAAGDIDSSQGHQLTYDKNGNRLTDRSWGTVVSIGETRGFKFYLKGADYFTDTYTYDELNRLQSTDRAGTIVDQRWYDGASRVVQSGPNSLPADYVTKLNEGVPSDQQIGMELRRQAYDVNGRVLQQRVFKSDGVTKKFDVVYQGVGRLSTALGYDNAGNVKAYEFRNFDGDDYTNTTTITLAKFEGYAESVTTTSSTKFQTGTSTSTYDANGFLTNVVDSTEYTLNKQMVNDAAGRVLWVYQNGNNLYTHMVNGEILGKFGVGPNEIDPRTKKNQANFQQVAEFDFGYRSISGSYPAPSVGSYTVRQGDSLQGIAQSAFGDSSQWWRIAQANGLQSDRDLRVGQTLTLPSTIAGTSNNASTFKPYNPSDVVGDTSPNLPQPKHKNCGAVGQIIMIVVAAVVTYYTAGLASGWLGAAIGGAAGSIASQVVGIAIGAQEGFSWKQVAAAAIGGAITAGVGTVLSDFGPAINNVVVKAAVSNALTQGVSVAVGVQKTFSWKGVAAAAVGAGVGQAVNTTLLGDQLPTGGWKMNTEFAQAIGNDSAAKFVSGTLAGIVSGVSVGAMRGGRVSMQQVAADAFGNALGQGLVDSMQQPSQMPSDVSASGASRRYGGYGESSGTSTGSESQVRADTWFSDRLEAVRAGKLTMGEVFEARYLRQPEVYRDANGNWTVDRSGGSLILPNDPASVASRGYVDSPLECLRIPELSLQDPEFIQKATPILKNGGFADIRTGDVHVLLFPSSDVSLGAVLSQNPLRTFTDDALDASAKNRFTAVINTQQYEGLPFFTPQGLTIENGQTVAGSPSPLRFFMSENQNGQFSFGMGDPPANSLFGLGGGNPLIVNGLRYSAENEWKPGSEFIDEVPPRTGDPGKFADRLLMRSNSGVKAFVENYEVGGYSGTGKVVVAYEKDSSTLAVVVQPNGAKEGMGLYAIRDSLYKAGFENALAFDGSTSATLVQGLKVEIAPSVSKDVTIPAGMGIHWMPPVIKHSK